MRCIFHRSGYIVLVKTAYISNTQRANQSRDTFQTVYKNKHLPKATNEMYYWPLLHIERGKIRSKHWCFTPVGIFSGQYCNPALQHQLALNHHLYNSWGSIHCGFSGASITTPDPYQVSPANSLLRERSVQWLYQSLREKESILTFITEVVDTEIQLCWFVLDMTACRRIGQYPELVLYWLLSIITDFSFHIYANWCRDSTLELPDSLMADPNGSFGAV